MACVYFITHPDVVVDPKVPVPQWPLSPRGNARMRAGLRQPWLREVRSVYCSTEQKAVDGALLVSDALGLTPIRRADLGENDRSATGFLPQEEFETTADEFFANPTQSIRGWETAAAAQQRVRHAVDAICAEAPPGDVAIVAHGAVGTLLLCHLAGHEIAREHDQPKEAVGGFHYAFDRDSRVLDHGWKRFDVLEGESRLDAERRRFAEEVRVRAQVKSGALIDAFAVVKREAFFGAGPWRVLGSVGYETTASDDPAVLYENILIAIDESRLLNNGEPTGLATWFDLLALEPGARVVHIGAGVGYYTAILAETVGSTGTVTGVELDQSLAARARENTAPWPQIQIANGDGAAFDLEPGTIDALFVNAGATELMPAWLDSLAPGGRLVLPMSTTEGGSGLGFGLILRIERRDHEFAAQFQGPVGIYPCIGARTETGNAALRAAFETGTASQVSRLTRAPHAKTAACWLHTPTACLR